jgi:glucokinase
MVMMAICYIEPFMHYLGIDVGGTSIKAGLVDETGKILDARRTPTIVDDLNGFLANLTALIAEFQTIAAVDAIGIGVPGLRSSKTHIIETSPNIPALKNINLEDVVAKQVHTRVVTENDANAGAYAEFTCGAGAGLKHMGYLTLGTGLGSGLVLNGQLFTGASGYGGEFGHTIIAPNGRPCRCGNGGCLETYVSATGMVITAQEHLRNAPHSLLHEVDVPLTSEIIYEAAIRGDVIAIEVFRQTGWYLGIACGNLINLLNLQMIVISGGVMASGDLLMQTANAVAQTHSFASSFRDCQIVQSRLWPEAGVIGAAMLARDR